MLARRVGNGAVQGGAVELRATALVIVVRTFVWEVVYSRVLVGAGARGAIPGCGELVRDDCLDVGVEGRRYEGLFFRAFRAFNRFFLGPAGVLGFLFNVIRRDRWDEVQVVFRRPIIGLRIVRLACHRCVFCRRFNGLEVIHVRFLRYQRAVRHSVLVLRAVVANGSCVRVDDVTALPVPLAKKGDGGACCWCRCGFTRRLFLVHG